MTQFPSCNAGASACLFGNMLQSLEDLQLNVGLGDNNLIRGSSSLLGVSDQGLDLVDIKLLWLESLNGRDGQLVARLNKGNAARDKVLLGLTALGDDLQQARSQLLNNWNVVGQDTQVTVDGGQVDLLNLRLRVQGLVWKSQGQLQGIGGGGLSSVSSSDNVGGLSGNLAQRLSEHDWFVVLDVGQLSMRIWFGKSQTERGFGCVHDRCERSSHWSVEPVRNCAAKATGRKKLKEKTRNKISEMSVLCIRYGQVVLVAVWSEKFRFRRTTVWLRNLPKKLDVGQEQKE